MTDAICYVLANDRLADTVLRVLEHFLTYHTPITEDYENLGEEYASEKHMLEYFQKNPQLSITRYWNFPRAARPQGLGTGQQKVDFVSKAAASYTPKIMVGAHFLADGHLIMSLTVGADDETEGVTLIELKQFLQSSYGLISYVNYSDSLKFDSAAEFKKLCANLE